MCEALFSREINSLGILLLDLTITDWHMHTNKLFSDMAITGKSQSEWCEFCCSWTQEDTHRRRDCPLLTDKSCPDGGCIVRSTTSAAVDNVESVINDDDDDSAQA